MGLFSLEASRAAYRADFWVYGSAVPLLALLLSTVAPHAQRPALAAAAVAGLALWTLVEYLLHRFVLHRVEPFRRWHGEHHARPTALIGTPTPISAALFATLVFAPLWGVAGAWQAAALTLGMLTGYLAYVLTHVATHHAAPPMLATNGWLRRRRRWHALHHRRRGTPGCYGVTSGLWDHLLGSARPAEGLA